MRIFREYIQSLKKESLYFEPNQNNCKSKYFNYNRNKMTINANTILDNNITFFLEFKKVHPYYSRVDPVYKKESLNFEPNQHNSTTFRILKFKRMEKSNRKKITDYFESIHKYQSKLFTDIKDLSLEIENLLIWT